MHRVLKVILAGGLAAIAAAHAHAQSPTEAQKSALRANCAGDFRAHCRGVSPGGMDALLCLERNEAQLSSGCKTAVDAVKGPQSAAAPKPAQSASTAPSTAAPSPSQTAPSEAAPAPSQAAPTAAAHGREPTFRQEVRVGARACFEDFNRFCPSLPLGHGNMVRCLREHAGSVSPGCHQAMAGIGARLR